MTRFFIALMVLAVFGRLLWESLSTVAQVLLVLGLVVWIPLTIMKALEKRRKKRKRRPVKDVKPTSGAWDRFGWTYVWWSPEGRPYIGESVRPEVRDYEHWSTGRLDIGPGWECQKKCWPSKAAAQDMEQVIYDQLVAEGHQPLNRMRPTGASTR